MKESLRHHKVVLQPLPKTVHVRAKNCKDAVSGALAKLTGVDCTVVSVNGRWFVSWCIACHGVILGGDQYFCDESGDRICGLCKQAAEATEGAV